MNIQNPYLEEKHKLIREQQENPNPETAQKIQELEAKSRAFVQEQIQQFDSKIEYTREHSNSIAKDYPSINKQYKQMMLLHRTVKTLAKEIGTAKVELIREMKAQRKKRTK